MLRPLLKALIPPPPKAALTKGKNADEKGLSPFLSSWKIIANNFLKKKTSSRKIRSSSLKKQVSFVALLCALWTSTMGTQNHTTIFEPPMANPYDNQHTTKSLWGLPTLTKGEKKWTSPPTPRERHSSFCWCCSAIENRESLFRSAILLPLLPLMALLNILMDDWKWSADRWQGAIEKPFETLATCSKQLNRQSGRSQATTDGQEKRSFENGTTKKQLLQHIFTFNAAFIIIFFI